MNSRRKMFLNDGLFKGKYFLCEIEGEQRILSHDQHTVSQLRGYAGEIAEQIPKSVNKEGLFDFLQENMEEKKNIEENYTMQELTKMIGHDVVIMNGVLYHYGGILVSAIKSFLFHRDIKTSGLLKPALFQLMIQENANDEKNQEDDNHDDDVNKSNRKKTIDNEKMPTKKQVGGGDRERELQVILNRMIFALQNGMNAKKASSTTIKLLVDFKDKE